MLRDTAMASKKLIDFEPLGQTDQLNPKVVNIQISKKVLTRFSIYIKGIWPLTFEPPPPLSWGLSPFEVVLRTTKYSYTILKISY